MVEDHVDSRDAVVLLLTSFGHRVRAAGDAAQATHLLGQAGANVLLADVLLPDASAWDLLRDLQARRLLPPYVITMSALHVWDVAHLSREAGCHAHLSKPLKDTELLSTLERACHAIH